MFNNKETHLTEKQFEVLKKKKTGKSLSEIADELNTSRSNVSHILATAKENVEKAENTLTLIRAFEWPVEIEIEAGSDLYDVSKNIFEKADEENIRINHTGSDLVDLLAEEISDRIENRKVQVGFSVKISKEGEVEVLVS